MGKERSVRRDEWSIRCKVESETKGRSKEKKREVGEGVGWDERGKGWESVEGLLTRNEQVYMICFFDLEKYLCFEIVGHCGDLDDDGHASRDVTAATNTRKLQT